MSSFDIQYVCRGHNFLFPRVELSVGRDSSSLTTLPVISILCHFTILSDYQENVQILYCNDEQAQLYHQLVGTRSSLKTPGNQQGAGAWLSGHISWWWSHHHGIEWWQRL
ncbi:unnamed protein product [Porites evermanni]|uniref:MHC class II antigen beta chain n=1 Tax=Porites evermanni TaxID=104178 RepID=A0ABN8PB35_9CNID|nr:unnamed protein product [Porites evermanni]